jgi:hypothetical protein
MESVIEVISCVPCVLVAWGVGYAFWAMMVPERFKRFTGWTFTSAGG